MKICIPTHGDEGLGATVAGHLGRAPFLTLVDTDTGEVTVLDNAPHGGGACRPAEPLAGRGVDAVVCARTGARALAALQAAGIQVLVTRAQHVDEAVAAVRRGALPVLGPSQACAGHGGDASGIRERCWQGGSGRTPA
jgi:predicted Fe-Mo cluster-binding NifX family protein